MLEVIVVDISIAKAFFRNY